MSLSYRTRRRWRHTLITLIIILCVAIIAFGGWLVWLDRYIIYTRDGAQLNFKMPPIPTNGEIAKPSNNFEPVKIVIQEAAQDLGPSVIEPVSINGYYVDNSDLKDNIPGILEKIQELPAGTAILMDMKNIKGSFYYKTTVRSTVYKEIDQEQMTNLLSYIANHDLYAIARIPAFRDWEYGLNHVPQGLPKKGGRGELWIDDKNCYWLDPTNEEVLGYLIRIITELKNMGFDEVVFSEFRFPDTEKIKFNGNKDEAIANAAATLVEACATDRFFISFQNTNYAFPLPSGNCRLYLDGVPAGDIPLVRQDAVTNNPAIQLLFITEANDTRFNDYCVLRPLNNAIIEEIAPE
jgi:hypothetical protein